MVYSRLLMQDIVTVEEAATFLHKHPDTIRRWIENKKLKARRLSAGGHGIYAILRNDLLELIVSGSLEAKEKPATPKVVSGQRSLPL